MNGRQAISVQWQGQNLTYNFVCHAQVPVHKHKYFADAPHGDLSVTDKVVREVLTLPLHSNMRPEFIERVIDGVTSYFSQDDA